MHEIVGVQLQASAFPAKLRVREILEEYRSFYRHPADVSELTGALGLAGTSGDYYRSLSGGQRQRLSVARHTPAGLAAQARGGKTVRFVPSAPSGDRLLAGLPEVTRVERQGQHVIVTGTGELVNAVILALNTAGLTAAKTSGAARGIMAAAFYPLMFFSGLYFPDAAPAGRVR